MHTTVAAVQDVPVGPEFFRPDLPLDQIQPSPLNPRTSFNEERLQELAASIREQGVIEPIVVRPMADHYELVAGERRWRAAQAVGLAAIPAMVRPLSDAQALEIMVVENNQRQDVNALEEGEGFSRLLGFGYEIEKLASRIGKSTKYIYDRIKLRELTPVAKQLVLDAKLTPGHAILLARLKPADQERALDPDTGGLFDDEANAGDHEDENYDNEDAYAGKKARSVREFNDWLATHVRFDPVHMAQAAPLDFGDTADQVALAAAKPGRGKKVIAITFEHYVQEDARDEHEKTYGPHAWKYADGGEHPVDRYSSKRVVSPECEHAVLGVVAAGVEQYGRAFPVCIARDRCDVHWKDEIREKEKNRKLRETGQETKAKARENSEEDRWRQQELKGQEVAKAWEALRPAAEKAFAAHVKNIKVDAFLVRQVVEGYRLVQS